MEKALKSSSPYLASPRTRFLLSFWNELRVEKQLPQLDRWLMQRFRADRRLGKKDRQWYSDALFAAMRAGLWICQRELEWQKDVDLSSQLPQASQGSWDELRALSGERVFLWLSLKDFPEHPFCSEQKEAGWLRDRLLAAEPKSEAYLQAGIAAEWMQAFLERKAHSHWTESQAQAFLQYQTQRARVWLRGSESQISALQRSWPVDEQHTLARKPGALGLAPESRIPEEFKQLELQDWASQCIGAALPLEKAQWVWDACAGGGGKTLQLAERLGGKGQIVASDIRGHKLEDLRSRASRHGYSNIHTVWWDGTRVPHFPTEVLGRKGFDAVLVDAPCSSTGTWRRSPDARYRLELQNLKELLLLQAQILERAAEQVRPGGFLCYATCSWLFAENEEQVSRFLKVHPDFIFVQEQVCGAPEEDADTMYWALMQRKGVLP